MIMDIYSIFGWLGMLLIITAYYLLSIKKLKSNSIIYNSLNLIGGGGIVISTFITKSWPAMALNIVWGIIAIFAIYKKLSIKPEYKELK